MLWHLGIVEGLVLWTNFYDDFPTTAPDAIAMASRHSAELMLRLLGWAYSSDPSKDLPFSASFAALGIVLFG